MLTNLMAFRNAARKAFQKFQFPIELAFKFIMAFAAYSRIVESLNYNETLGKGLFRFLFGVAGMILPPIVTIMLCIVVAVYEVFSGSPIIAALVFVILLILYCFAARFSGKFAYALVAIPLLMRFNLHYLVALILGMTATPLAIFPSAVGIISYYVFGAVKNTVTGDKVSSLDDVLALYVKFLNDVFANKEMIFIIGIFAAVIIVMWALRHIRFDYSFEITIIIGGVLMILGHVFAAGVVDMSVSTKNVILGSVFSMILVYIVQFFRIVLDYSAVENVQFEDDDYYYYVKAVPKLDKVILGEITVSEKTDENSENKDESKKHKKTAIGEMIEQSEKEKELAIKAREENEEAEAKEEEERLIREGEQLDMNDSELSVYKAVFSGISKKKKNDDEAK